MMSPIQLARLRRLIALRTIAQKRKFAAIPPVDTMVVNLVEHANTLDRPYAEPALAAHNVAAA